MIFEKTRNKGEKGQEWSKMYIPKKKQKQKLHTPQIDCSMYPAVMRFQAKGMVLQ